MNDSINHVTPGPVVIRYSNGPPSRHFRKRFELYVRVSLVARPVPRVIHHHTRSSSIGAWNICMEKDPCRLAGQSNLIDTLTVEPSRRNL